MAGQGYWRSEAVELNLELKRIFRITGNMVIFTTRMNLSVKVDFVKRTLHPDFNDPSLKVSKPLVLT